MSDVAALLLAIIIIVALVCLAAMVWNYNVRRRAASHIAKMPWKLEEHGTGAAWILLCIRPGTQEQRVIANIPWEEPDFDNQVEEARINGEVKLHTLNRGLPR